ncbi:excinuclease ABC subunit UvrA [Acetobacter syzygii]|uniref:UvrABC system protein A n=1 Tax=Acetobacter syzygii TaxID=146476 RepID=A0A270BLS8_9PROT|nr:excinuclease ABC subunit UvrA [Acetobacter syzygii]PAL25973.1 excinuclease ABC subunit A [Acetobacter syzygii]PAL26093.1 excinuclease ABC subunit A [Acetobacter syzygii]GAN70434.1 excinuclease ABC subunit A UvrA [Acetobacter syzygii]GBR61750.1 excinuclease ABC subunit A [Acetobacter syzygii NRIC 0483]GEL56956.1 UvrABC system protein A [Acetobacter syzygii]
MNSVNEQKKTGQDRDDGYVHVRGAREHNLQNVNVDIPRDSLVVFTGLSGSGKSSLAFGTLYAEAQRRYLESVSPYARRLFQQMPVPDVDVVDGLPPAIALQQQRGGSSGRSSVGSLTTLSNLLRMLYSRAGVYPPGLARLEAESFSPNTPMGACQQCHGLGRIHDVTEARMVPDPSLTIRQRAVASWPTAWQGQNLRDILITKGVNVDIPWRDLPKKTRDWILFTEETPTYPVYPGLTHAQVRQAMAQGLEPAYQGTFTGARRYILQTFAHSQSAMMRRRVEAFMTAAECPSCQGLRLNADALSVTFGGYSIAAMTALPLEVIAATLRSVVDVQPQASATAIAAERIVADMIARIGVLEGLGLGYLQMDRSVQTLSPGEYQRLRLGTQIHSNLFGVVYVLDEPSAGLHPADTQALLTALRRLQGAGNSLFLVEHNLDIVRHAQWVVDVGPQAGTRGGTILYSGPLAGLKDVTTSHTKDYVFATKTMARHTPGQPTGWLHLQQIQWNNLHNLNVSFPLGVLVSVTGVSGSGKSSLVSQVLTSVVARALGQTPVWTEEEGSDLLNHSVEGEPQGLIAGGGECLRRLVVIDQKPIGRTPRSNLATYTGLFDIIRKLYARTELAQERGYDAGYFSFNLPKGRCPTCEGAGATMVELLFLPSVYAPCPTCRGKRYKPEILEVTYKDRSIAELLAMTVDEACLFLAEDAGPAQILTTLQRGGLGHLTLGQPATELSGGEAQRIKLATELQKQRRGHTLYVLDEPTTGLHPFDADRLMEHLHELVQAGNTVIVAEHDMRLVARSDWVIDLGPGAGNKGGRIVAEGKPHDVAQTQGSITAPFLARYTG